MRYIYFFLFIIPIVFCNVFQFTLQAEKLEKVDRETAKAIYEECRKVAELVGDVPMSFKTPIR